MKKILLVTLLNLSLLFSCNSNEENEVIDSPISKEELLAIKSKLQYLETSRLNSQDLKPEEFSNLVSKRVNKNYNSCSHEQIFNYTENGFTLEVIENYYDVDMNEITSCDIFLNPKGYYLFAEQKTTGNNRAYHLFSKSLISMEISTTNASFSEATDIYGNLKIEDAQFEILKGSYANLALDVEIDENIAIENLEELIPELDLLYKIEFATNEDSYHFDMKANSTDFNEIINAIQTGESGEYSIEYALYNTNNTQVGFVKYVLELDTELERFDVFDLSNNHIE